MDSMKKLSPGQSRVLEFIRAHSAAHGLPPTQAEIAQGLGFASRTAAKDHLLALARKGALELVPGASRGIRLLDGAPAGLPLIGRVAAGSPLLAVENIESRHAVDPALFRPRADYLLRVQGQSMRDIGILDGDLLAVHRTPEARDGQIVVARLDDEVTVKRLRRRGAVIQLLAENPDYAPLTVDPKQQTLHIEGLAVGVIRATAP